ncbi:MAG TPA: hypothetical protein VJN02_06085 [Gammaproteobacteria bacterium]|nr:hypothetical protein [Gammaproteobacteria bacterium]
MPSRKNAHIIMDKIYEDEITNFFKSWVKNYCNIDCFAVLVILPNNDMLHLSTHPTLTKIYHERKYGLYDQPVIKKFYENFPFYPWRQINYTRIQNEIHTIREKIFNLNSGTNFVRIINSIQGKFHIIYCVSTYNKDPLNYFKFACNVNKILEVGDFAYNTLLPIFQENCNSYTLPRIKKFVGFDYDNIALLCNNYVLQKEIAERLIFFLEQSHIEDKTDFKLKSSLKLVAINSHPVITNNPKFVPYLIK